MTTIAEKEVAITGIGQSNVTRGTDRSPLDLTIDAALEAIRDAGLHRSDIDGLATWPAGGSESQGFAPVGTPMLQDALRLNVNWYLGTGETSGQLGAVFNAIGSIAAGVTTHVLVFRTVYEGQARKVRPFANAMARSEDRVEGAHSWFAPYWSLAAATQQALFFQRYMHESGATSEQVAQIALNGRRNAQLNPKAIYRDSLTMDDYLTSRWISTPLRGRRTDLTPADVDVAELYDGFSFHSLVWLESFGFCKRYEAPSFVEGGKRIALDGEIPINTSGGQLSAGRLHGYGQVHEACVQLWGRGGARQVPGDPRVAVTSTAGGPLAGCLLLVRQ